MAPIVFTPQLKFLVSLTVILGLVAVGIWIERGQQAKKEVKVQTARADFSDVQARKLDYTLAEKAKTEGRTQKELGEVFDQRDNAANEDPAYEDYLDRPLPAATRELYKRAGAIQHGPPGADGTDGKRRKED